MDAGDSSKGAKLAPSLEKQAPRFGVGASTLTILWVDDAQLSRETTVTAVAAALPYFRVRIVQSLADGMPGDGPAPALIVYYGHSGNTIDVSAIKEIRGHYPHIRLIVLSDASAVPEGVVRDVLSLDVAGFILTRQAGLQMVVSAINLVHSGGTFLPRELLFMDGETETDGAIAPGKTAETARLTQRELDVLKFIREGIPNKRIAEELAMSASTVKVHVRNIMHKLGAANRTQVALGAEVYLGNGRDR